MEDEEGTVDAGDFSAWLGEMVGALGGEHGSDVPCGSCTGCCTSSQFIHIGPDETDTLAHVPADLLFAAPGRPGHVLLGYDERGHCPMLVDERCTIYDHRPMTCRTYDCRVLAAADLELDEPAKAAIAERARRWRFAYATADAERQHDAVRAAAAYLGREPDALPDPDIAQHPTTLAALAIEVHDLFVDDAAEPAPEAIRAEIRRRTRPASSA